MTLTEAIRALPREDQLFVALDILAELDGTKAPAFIAEAQLAGLTRFEARIAHALNRRCPNIVPVEVMMQILWPCSEAGGSNTLSVHIHRLRTKVATKIINVHGQGWRIDQPIVLPQRAQDDFGAAARCLIAAAAARRRVA